MKVTHTIATVGDDRAHIFDVDLATNNEWYCEAMNDMIKELNEIGGKFTKEKSGHSLIYYVSADHLIGVFHTDNGFALSLKSPDHDNVAMILKLKYVE